MDKRDQFNQSGCRDMTAYLALRKIEREELEAARAHKPGYRRRMRRTKGNNRNTNHTSH